MDANNGPHVKIVDPAAAGSAAKTPEIDYFNSYSKEQAFATGDTESVFNDETLERRETDYKKKQKFKGWMLWWLAYQSTGVIYGDIGTSPLYVYSSTFSSEPSYDDLLGALSLIIWSLTLIVTLKYVCIVLFADDEGEGGTFAMYNLLSRYSNIVRNDPRAIGGVKMARYKTNELRASNRGVRAFLENSKFSHALLKVVAVFGVSLIMADGILTPAQSVLGAIQGLVVVDPTISIHVVVGTSCGVLIVLFVLQPLGITKLSSTFAPIVVIWLTINFGFGVYNLIHFDHSVLKAFSPYYAGLWFVRNKTDGWRSLGGILLAFTGVEALFADIGAFTPNAVRISWLGLAYPCLIVAYIGQAAYISVNKGSFANPFFESVPPHMLWPSLIIAILAAIVASQALITSTFQLLSQVMNTSYFPHINMIYTSDKFHGQVYIPIANWLMMIGTVIVTVVYDNTTKLGNAYGTCVILVTFITTTMVSLIAIVVWKLHWLLVLAVWVPFVTLDGLFLSSALTKIPDGAWFTLLLATVLSSIFVLWRYGKEKQWAAEETGVLKLSTFIRKNEKGLYYLPHSMGGRELNPIKGIAIFFDKGGDGVPPVFQEFVRKFEALPAVQVLLHLRGLSRPYASDEERFEIIKTPLSNCYRMIVRYGYNDIVVTEGLGDLVYEKLKEFIANAPLRSQPQDAITTGLAVPGVDGERSMSSNEEDRKARRLAVLEEAYSAQTVYIVGKEQLRLLKERNNIVKRILLYIFMWLRDNTRAKVASMRIPIDKLVEVGFVKEI